MASNKARVLIIGAGSVGIMAAYAIHVGGCADVTVVMRSNFAQVEKNGIDIDSIDHGHDIKGWRPDTSMWLLFNHCGLFLLCHGNIHILMANMGQSGTVYPMSYKKNYARSTLLS